MKRFLIAILLLLVSFNSNAGKYKVTVALNLKDCINCVKAFYQLTQFADQVDVTLVMNKEYKSDSAYIFKTYELKKLKPAVKWSDSLFDVYSPTGSTMISLESEHATERIRYPLGGMTDPFFTYLKKATLETDTLFKDIPDISRGVSELVFDGKNLAMLVNYRKEVNVYDLISQSRQYTITVSDDLLRKTFAYSGLPASAYDEQQRVMQEAGVPERYKLSDITFSGDTMTILLDTHYFEYLNSDTILQHNFSFLKYVKGKLLSVHKLEVENTINGKLYNNMFSYIHTYQGQLYTYIADYPLTQDRYFLGKCNLANNKYVINEAYDMKVPDLYKDDFGCSFPLYYKGYFAFPLIGTLYPLEKNDTKITLSFFLGMKTLNCSAAKSFIFSFQLNRNYVWLVMGNYNQPGGDKMEFVKYNIKAGSVEISPMKFGESVNQLMAFDPINPDFLIYKSADGYLIRKRAFQ